MSLNLRSSQVHKICTERPFFSLEKKQELRIALKSLEEKLYKKKSLLQQISELGGVNYTSLAVLNETHGFKTLAKNISRLLEQKAKVTNDQLSKGAKNNLKKIWLENYGLYDYAQGDEKLEFQKGTLCEKAAIALVARYYNLKIEKNCDRFYYDIDQNKRTGLKVPKGNYSSGECDVKYKLKKNKIIRETKCPVSWLTWQKKIQTESLYYWQVQDYMFLYGCDYAYLDYVLMKTPEQLKHKITSRLSSKEIELWIKSEAKIEQMPLNFRIKTFKILRDEKAISFMNKRKKMALMYYNELTYEKCMNIYENELVT